MGCLGGDVEASEQCEVLGGVVGHEAGAQGRESRRPVERADGEARGKNQDGDVREIKGRGGVWKTCLRARVRG